MIAAMSISVPITPMGSVWQAELGKVLCEDAALLSYRLRCRKGALNCRTSGVAAHG